MATGNKLYVSATDTNAGSSMVVLGLLGVLKQKVDHIGFFKPVGRGTSNTDATLMKAAHDLKPTPSQMCPMSIAEARQMMARGEEARMLDCICSAYDVIRGSSDFVVLEGINYQRSISAVDMDINASIAARMAAPVVLVAGATSPRGPLSPDELIGPVLAAKASFQKKDCDVIGAIINRISDETSDDDRNGYLKALEQEKIAVFGAMPEFNYLKMPRLTHIVDGLGAEVLAGKDLLRNLVTHTLVAAMEPRNFLNWLQCDHTLIICPGDREDLIMAIALTQMSAQYRRISGLVLTGGLRPDPAILNLIRDMTVPEFPILSVTGDTYGTATAIRNLRVRIGPDDHDKIFAACASVEQHTDTELLWKTISLEDTRPAKAGSFLETIVSKAKAHEKTIVFPEGDEPRTIRAVSRLAAGKILKPILLGNIDAIREKAKTDGVSLDGVQIIDPATSDKRDQYAEMVYEIRKDKKGGMTRETAIQWLDHSTIQFGVAMVQAGDADGLVAGAIHSTGDTVRPALQIIGVRPGVDVASSVFLMVFKDRVLTYGDCAIIPSPNTKELASIAIASAHTARTFGINPKVAMLSYSTGTSGSGTDVDKVTEATRIVREREPFLAIDGPMQYDAAIDPEVGKAKQPNSPVAGQATVFIFPDLDAGNIAYKAVQRMSGALAVGPIMQGMRKPVNDLSRGCSVDDIYYVGAITAVQAGGV